MSGESKQSSSQSHETQIYILKQFIINRPTIAKLKLPKNDMTVWFHLLTSPSVITSCQNGFLYSALATSSGSGLKKTGKKGKKKRKMGKKKKKTTNKKTKTVHQILHLCRVWSRACPDTDLYRLAIDDIYSLTKKSEKRGKRSSQSLQMYISDLFLVSHGCFSYVMPSFVTAIMQQNQNKQWDYSHICLEQISPVFIIVVSVNVAVALHPQHW